MSLKIFIILIVAVFVNCQENFTTFDDPIANVSLLETVMAANGSLDNAVESGCEPAIPCMDDKECLDGMCFGWGVKKCNCAACVSFVRCEGDEACGGLYGACIDGYCDCELGFRNNGLRSLKYAYEVFCSIKDCGPNGDTAECFGLPCNSGICICPPVKV